MLIQIKRDHADDCQNFRHQGAQITGDGLGVDHCPGNGSGKRAKQHKGRP